MPASSASRKLPGLRSTAAGAGMTWRVSASPARPQPARAATRARQACSRFARDITVATIKQGRRSCLLRPDSRLGSSPSELGAEAQVILRAVLVEGPRLVLVERVVLERRIV